MRLFALSFLLLALPPFHSGIRPLAPAERAQLNKEFWHAGCPVPLSALRLLTVSYWDFDGNVQTGELVVNRSAAGPLAKVFRQLYRLLPDPVGFVNSVVADFQGNPEPVASGLSAATLHGGGQRRATRAGA